MAVSLEVNEHENDGGCSINWRRRTKGGKSFVRRRSERERERERDHQPIGHSRYKSLGESLQGSMSSMMLMSRAGNIHRVRRCPRSRLKARADIFLSAVDDKTSYSFSIEQQPAGRTPQVAMNEKDDEKSRRKIFRVGIVGKM